MSEPLLIVGFHRSGTSAVARMFHHAGVDLGGQLLGAEPANPYGHFEDVELVAMHDRFLARAGQSWKSTDAGNASLSATSLDELATYVEQRQAAANPKMPWGVKDPRLCLFLDQWLQTCPESRVVLVVRRPGEAIRSLHMRHSRRHVDLRGADPSDLDFWRDPDLGVKLWINYHQRVLEVIDRVESPLIVDFSDRTALAGLLAEANTRWAQHLDLDDIVTPDPRLGTAAIASTEVGSSALLAQAEDVWASLRALVNVT